MYPIQGKLRPAETLLPEEQQVIKALRHYCFDLERTTCRDFTPTFVLYEAYRKLRAEYIDSADAPDLLNPTQFGIALRRVFEIDAERKAHRRYQGKMRWGYLGVKGPDSAIVQRGPGNPWLIRARANRQGTTVSTAKMHGLSTT
jgi:hypothetical protein